ncbi:membrane protein insertion efficiency factor YidD [Vibrio fluvialis]|nr:membrane protein insertion efficiency factor YidD [Vibrio fluvialis]EKO3461334.1 membrane protein insertion efficiency factor YidD [Vibrio fluvialis]
MRLIYLYRIIAPNKLRQSCLFEPSCSEYAILSLKKHGFVKGWQVALNRISRCKQPNGGVDYP